MFEKRKRGGKPVAASKKAAKREAPKPTRPLREAAASAGLRRVLKADRAR